jgi:hypothetical protein
MLFIFLCVSQKTVSVKQSIFLCPHKDGRWLRAGRWGMKNEAASTSECFKKMHCSPQHRHSVKAACRHTNGSNPLRLESASNQHNTTVHFVHIPLSQIMQQTPGRQQTTPDFTSVTTRNHSAVTAVIIGLTFAGRVAERFCN